MAQRQKKKSKAQRHKQQQKKQQRRNVRVSKRPRVVAGRTPAEPYSASGFSPSMSKQILEIVWDSSDLAEEPELVEVAIAPLEAANAYMAAAEELGIYGLDMLNDLAEEKRTDTLAEILENAADELLTDDLRAQIIGGLEALHRRWQKAGQQVAAQRAAAVQSLLERDNIGELAATIGLVQAVVLRSVHAGFLLMSTVFESEDVEIENASPREIHRRLQAIGSDEQLASLLETPGIKQVLEKQVNNLWEDGEKALFNGELHLALFHSDELDAAAEIFGETRAEIPLAPEGEHTDTFIQELMTRITQFLMQTFTPERQQQLQERLDEIVNDPAYGSTRFVPFLMLMREELADDEALVENYGYLLMKTLLGEMKTVAADVADDDDEATGETTSQ